MDFKCVFLVKEEKGMIMFGLLLSAAALSDNVTVSTTDAFSAMIYELLLSLLLPLNLFLSMQSLLLPT